MMVYLLLILFWAWLYFKLKQMERINQDRERLMQTWLFESLYSINPKVLLPTDRESQMISKKAEVYKPELDPMQEFKGTGL